MKIETIVTAIIFFSVGFLGGYIFKSELQTHVPAAAAAVSTSSAAGSSSGATAAGGGNNINPSTGLPNGHPPLKVAQIIEDYAQQADKDPKNAQIPLQLANYLYDKKYFNLAIQWYQRSLNLNPRNSNALTDLGTSFFYTGQPQRAITQYKKALALNPKHQPTLFNMIVVNLEGTHDLPAANKYWRELDRLNPNYSGLKEIKERLDAATGSASSAMK